MIHSISVYMCVVVVESMVYMGTVIIAVIHSISVYMCIVVVDNMVYSYNSSDT